MAEALKHPVEEVINYNPLADLICNGGDFESIKRQLSLLGFSSLLVPFAIIPKTLLFSHPKFENEVIQAMVEEFGDPVEMGFGEIEVYSVVSNMMRKWEGPTTDNSPRLFAANVIDNCEGYMRRFGDDPAQILKLLVYGNYESWETQPDFALRGFDTLFEGTFVESVKKWLELREEAPFRGIEAGYITDVLEVGALLTSRAYKLTEMYKGKFVEVERNIQSQAINEGLDELLRVLNENEIFGLQVRHLRFFVEFKKYIKYDPNQDIWFYTGGYDESKYDPTRANQITPIVDGTLANCWETDRDGDTRVAGMQTYSRVFVPYEFEKPPKGKAGCNQCALRRYCDEYLDSVGIDLKALREGLLNLVSEHMQALTSQISLFCETNKCAIVFYPGQGFGVVGFEVKPDKNILPPPAQSEQLQPTSDEFVTGEIDDYWDRDGSFIRGVPGVYGPLPEIQVGEIASISLDNLPGGHIILVYAAAKKIALERSGVQLGRLSHVSITRIQSDRYKLEFYYHK